MEPVQSGNCLRVVALEEASAWIASYSELQGADLGVELPVRASAMLCRAWTMLLR